MSSESICCPTPSAPLKSSHPHPPSVSLDYELKGRYEKIEGFDKVYVTGPSDSKHAIVVIYDIFGFWETTLRGSDLIVQHLNETKPTSIFMPDLFHGHPFPKEQDGNQDELKKFFAGTAKLSDRLPELLKFTDFLKAAHAFETISVLGYCWGGKLALLSLSSDLAQSSPFASGAIVHPAMLAKEDGENLSRPLGLFPSKDEPKDIVNEIAESIKTKSFASKCEYHLYSTVHHGWAAARANLHDPENLKQYEDVYARLAKFYAQGARV